MDETARINAEWIVLNAFRGVTKIAAKGDLRKTTYDNALEFGGELYPALLGPDASILKRERESDLVKEYRQRARAKSSLQGREITAIDLLRTDIEEYKTLIEHERRSSNKEKSDLLKKKLTSLIEAEKEINHVPHTENQLIFRDAYAAERTVPVSGSGQAYRDFELPDSNILRVRVLHPDKPEHITGADIIYERHNPLEQKASIVVVQYKIWEDKVLYLTDQRMLEQINRLEKFTCSGSICEPSAAEHSFRFPCCSAFIRPTDKLQRADQKFISSGEHLPICKINECQSKGTRGAPILEYKKIQNTSLSSEMFEQLFNKGKIGSRMLSYDELASLYKENEITADENNVIIYAQEFTN